MSAQLTVSAEKIIRAARKTYQSIPPDDDRAQTVVLNIAASLLDLEDEDYADLVRHLITAEEIDEDARRWATNVSNYGPPPSTVPEGSQGGGWNVSTTSGWTGRTTGGR